MSDKNQNLFQNVILPQGYQRLIGKEAIVWNIRAARLVAEAVRSTLGPKGMDKMLVNELGDVIITNDGVTILKEMELVHPAAKLMVEIAKTQEQEVGDGTTSVVVFAGELLKKAEDLMIEGLHPTQIIEGYQIAKEEALKVLGELAEEAPSNENELRELLLKCANTALYSKVTERERKKLAELAVDAVLRIAEKTDEGYNIDKDRIKFEKKPGASILESEVVDGLVIDKEIVHPNMPKKAENAKVLLLASPLEIKSEIDMKYQITDPTQLKAVLEEEKKLLKDMADKIAQLGVKVVFCQKGIDDLVQSYLAKNGIIAVRRVKKSDMEKLSHVTGAKIVNNLDEVSEDDLGTVRLIEQRKVGNDNMIFVLGESDKTKVVTILLKGGSEKVVDEVERAMEDAIGVISTILKYGKYVAGGGSIEVELAKRLRQAADKVSGKEQLAVYAFAEALEVIPRTLAENAGLDALDILVKLRSKHEEDSPDARWYGIDVFKEDIANMKEQGIIEPLRVKEQVIKSAYEIAQMILRIDDVIAASLKSSSKEGGADFEE